MNINYNTLTAEQLEEHVEFIDWSLVPPRLITDEIKKSFSMFKGLQARLWFEYLLFKMEKKEDKEKFPNETFFLIDDMWYMHIDLKTNNLSCSSGRVWIIFERFFDLQYFEIRSFIKNQMEMHLNIIGLTPGESVHTEIRHVEKHFSGEEIWCS